MKKFAAIFAAVILTVSVFMVSASAKLFSDDSYFQYSGSFYSLPQNTGTPIGPFTSIEVSYLGSVVFTEGWPEGVYIARNRVTASDNNQPFLYVYDSDQSDRSLLASYSGVEFNNTASVKLTSSVGNISFGTVSSVTVPSAVSSLSGGVFDVGDSLLTFIQSSWLTLLALGAFLVVLCIGAIRRLVKGV